MYTHTEVQKKVVVNEIKSVEENVEGPGSAGLTLDDGTMFNVGRDVTQIRWPHEGDYLVRWEGGKKIRIKSSDEVAQQFILINPDEQAAPAA